MDDHQRQSRAGGHREKLLKSLSLRLPTDKVAQKRAF
jgi:hypothetical protein